MTSIRVKEFTQPSSFEFSDESKRLIARELIKYPKERKQSAVMALLHIAQKQQGGWIPEKAMQKIAELLDMPDIKVYEVATFYTMYKLRPMGKYHIDICRSVSCQLCGKNEVVKACENKLGIKVGETTEDGMFSLEQVECLGACVNAPVAQISGEKLYEHLDAAKMVKIIEGLKNA